MPVVEYIEFHVAPYPLGPVEPESSPVIEVADQEVTCERQG